jgi:hypothetical protein
MAIRTESIEELLHKDPFSPFKIFTADGKEYPVQNPDFVHVFRAEIFYVFAGNERWTLIPISHVTGIEVNAAA